jgi:hypothetical protein
VTYSVAVTFPYGLGGTEIVPGVAKVRVADGALFLLGPARYSGEVAYAPPVASFSLHWVVKWVEIRDSTAVSAGPRPGPPSPPRLREVQ